MQTHRNIHSNSTQNRRRKGVGVVHVGHPSPWACRRDAGGELRAYLFGSRGARRIREPATE